MLFTSCLYSFRVPKQQITSYFFLDVQDLPVSGIQRSQSGDPCLESRWAAPVTRGGEPSPARCGPVTSLRWRGGERKDAPGHAAGQAYADSVGLCHAQYRLLFRLAVFLTGDADAAQTTFLPGHQPVPGPDLD